MIDVLLSLIKGFFSLAIVVVVAVVLLLIVFLIVF